MINKKIVIETPISDNKIKHNLISKLRELLNIYTLNSVQNIGFICGLNKNNNSDMCYIIDIVDATNDNIYNLYNELNKLNSISLIKDTQYIMYYKLT
jgi:hypothetical protein